MRSPRRARWAVLVLVLGGSVAFDWHLLFGQPYVIGVKAYTWLLAARNVWRWPPPAFPVYPILLSMVGGVAGPAHAIKILALAFAVAFAVGVFALAEQLTHSGWASLAATTIAAFGPGVTFLLVDFPEAFCGLALLTWAGAALAAKRRKLTAGLMIVAALCSGWVLVAVVAFGMTFGLAHLLDRPRGLGFVYVISALAWSLPAAMSHLGGSALPAALQGELLFTPDWPLGAVAGVSGKAVLILLALIWLAYAVSQPGASRTATALALLGLVFLANPFLNFSNDYFSIAGRLDGLAFMAAALLAAPVLAAIPRRLEIPAAAALIALTLIGAAREPIPTGANAAFITSRAQLVSGLEARKFDIPPGATIVAPEEDSDPVRYLLQRETSSSAPYGDGRARTYWLLRGVPTTLASPDMLLLYVQTNGTAAVLEPDGALRDLLARVPAQSALQLRARNASLALPAPPDQ